MKLEEFKKTFIKQLNQININLNENQINQFYNYMNLLIETNKKVNLTAITEPEEIISKHFIDSLSTIQFIKKEDKIIDVGTGAGFPGIPIKIVNPNARIFLLDSLNKRIEFLNNVIQQLKLEKIYLNHNRAEDLGQDKMFREQYDVAISRAVAPLNVLVEYLAPFVKVGGICICMKSTKSDEELLKSKNAIQKLGLEMQQERKIILPETEFVRNIIVLKKIKSTNKQYPRKAGTPSKKPL